MGKPKSELETVITFELRDFFETDERVADTDYPKGQVILTTD